MIEKREQRRIAAALHDGVTQHLALAQMTLHPVRQKQEAADRIAMDAAAKLIDAAIDETRSLSSELSPPLLYDLGIRAALSWLSEKLGGGTGLRVEISADGPDPVLDDVTAYVVFRTVREPLMNVVKHARSATAAVSFRHHPGHLEVVVEDGGVGSIPRIRPPARASGS